jgi:palmitoyltransferase
MISMKPINGRLERWGNALENTALGPFCIFFASSLILVGTISFCEWDLLVLSVIFTHYTIDDIIAPGLSYPVLLICILITINLYMHYYYAITIPPGFLQDPPHSPMNSLLWAQKKDNGKQAIVRGATWTENGVKITPGCPTKCRSCRTFRPEVRLIFIY